MQNTPQRKSILQLLVPWPVLTFLAVFTYASFMKVPHVGFDFSNQLILAIYAPFSPDSLHMGDKLIIVDGVDIDAFYGDLNLGLLEDARPGDTISILVERDGDRHQVDWRVPGITQASLIDRFIGIWWLPYVFWAAGTATLLFIRPKDSRWRLLIAFNYLNAIWIGVGNGPSRWHIWQGGPHPGRRSLALPASLHPPALGISETHQTDPKNILDCFLYPGMCARGCGMVPMDPHICFLRWVCGSCLHQPSPSSYSLVDSER